MRQRIGTYPTTRPLRCDRCRQLGLQFAVTVDPGIVEKRVRDGRYRNHASVSCSNGPQWWSLHPEAIREARLANRRASAQLDPPHQPGLGSL